MSYELFLRNPTLDPDEGAEVGTCSSNTDNIYLRTRASGRIPAGPVGDGIL
jgi:hypothetical protein